MILVYNKEYYLKTKSKHLEYQRKYRKKHRETILSKRREYDRNYKINNLELINNRRKEYRLKNAHKIKRYRDDHKEQARQYSKLRVQNGKQKIASKKFYQNHPEKIKAYYKMHSQLPHVKKRRAECARIWRKENPRSYGIADLELQYAMNRVRLRDNNTCKWYGCGLTFRQAPIHVHHIFPRNEYPDLELIEKYMICYCANHHALFHRFRGDWYSEMINPRYQEGLFEPLLSGKGRG